MVEVVLRGMHAVVRFVALNIREKPLVHHHESASTIELDLSFPAAA
jgi:hypothetical protein